MTTQQRGFFAANGFLNLGPVLDRDETACFEAMFDADRRKHPFSGTPTGIISTPIMTLWCPRRSSTN